MTRKNSPFNYNHIFVDTNVLVETGGDIEDNVQFVLARKQKCSIIVTNNYKDYRLFYNISVVKPDEVRSIPQ